MPQEKTSLAANKSDTNKPELKIGPFAGGIGVTVWRNATTDGRAFRSITIAPRRYRDDASGEWKDSPSYRPIDLAALILALQKAQEFITTTPLPDADTESPTEASPSETPF